MNRLTSSVDEAVGRVPVTVMTLVGEIDASNFEGLIDEVKSLRANGCQHLLIDLAGVTFIASSGLIALHSIVRLMHDEAPDDLESGWGAFHSLDLDNSTGSTQTEVQLCGQQAAVARVLQRTGMDRLFPVHADRTAALAAF